MPTKEFFKYLDNNELERLRIRLKLEKGEIIELVCLNESFINGKWNAIVRYDTAHGFFHRDVNGDQKKYSIEMDSLKVAASFAEQDIKDRWKFYKNRYIKKLKK